VGVLEFRRSSDGGIETVPLGAPTDVVTSGDFDGDGKDDLATLRGSGGVTLWSILERDGGGTGTTPIAFGDSGTDSGVPGDYDGDGKMDIATWTGSGASAGLFRVRRSSDGVVATLTWGQAGDYPVANAFIK